MHTVALFSLLTFAQGSASGQRAYLALAEATLRNPVTKAQLSDAALSKDGVASIRALFDQSIADSLSLSGALVTPELGGESMLVDGRIVWVSYPDAVHAVIRQAVAHRADPTNLLGLLESSPEGRDLLKTSGGLHALLYQMSNASPTTDQRALLDSVIESAVAQHFKTWSTDPLIQATMIERTQWRGRYSGFWHIHPPRWRDSAAVEGIEPSVADMQNAIELGQFLTIVFQPDGFDLYDLSPLALVGRVDLSRVEVIRYRSHDWRVHFDAKLASAVHAPQH